MSLCASKICSPSTLKSTAILKIPSTKSECRGGEGWGRGGAHFSPSRYVCAVSKKQITFQAAVVIKPSNCVVLGKVYTDLVKPTMTCPITR